MNHLRKEFEVFLHCSHSMQVLMVSNMIYALVLPVIEIFVAAYVMRNSHAVDKVVTYQLSIYAATPLAFYLNGKLLGRVGAKHLYAAGMLLSGVAMMLMMQLSILTPIGVATSGFTMGLATGIFWANRGYLALTATNDSNRNYYYGVENFVASLAAVVVPALIGLFISGTALYGWLGGVANRAYHIIAMVVFGLTILAAGILERGTFRNPKRTPLRLLPFSSAVVARCCSWHCSRVWPRDTLLPRQPCSSCCWWARRERSAPRRPSAAVFSACLMYMAGRIAAPKHRIIVFSAGLLLFFLGAVTNTLLFNAVGVLIFIGCLLLAKPLAGSCLLSDPACRWSTWSPGSKDATSTPISSTTNSDCFWDAALGCGLFLGIAFWGSGIAALKYALPVIALMQLLSIRVAGQIFRGLTAAGNGTSPVASFTASKMEA